MTLYAMRMDRCSAGSGRVPILRNVKRTEERLQQENFALREEIEKNSMFEEIVGTSSALTTVLSRVSKVAATDSTVLIVV